MSTTTTQHRINTEILTCLQVSSPQNPATSQVASSQQPQKGSEGASPANDPPEGAAVYITQFNAGDDNLTDTLPTSLPVPAEYLAGKRNWVYWEFIIRSSLAMYNAAALIRKDIPRPTKGDKGYKTWRRWSGHVGLWLPTTLSKRLLNEYLADPPQDCYADEVFDVIYRLAHKWRGVETQTTILRYTRIAPSSFGRPVEFIDAFMEAYLDANAVSDGCFHPYPAALRFLDSLQDEDGLGIWVRIREAELAQKDIKLYKDSDLRALVYDMLGLGSQPDVLVPLRP
ncbi:hypothetical protein BP00DRAFT_476071 [Aspergillus indologenus CBS 114.80]|uniref:Uncharacterized protein n=1 Tax=Aspergillus indologenus CBS 114.80 TaxID=1450541 RepID=A0A2V5J831_9EURO|nr:hypothetical protein BP00DRAFT_476071 [Aspergillus indologenus CBS 114.80]